MMDQDLYAQLKKHRMQLEHDANVLIDFLKGVFLDCPDYSVKLYELLINGNVCPTRGTTKEKREESKNNGKLVEIACKYAGVKAILDIMDAEDIEELVQE